ncbi:ThiF family adenylyltransferase [Lentzea sp. NPDC059081]|uniref:ThiF family adenylyltransferase n=1 Tax=Lentzea sp. NPDC059081 TaxID=3346719 RepID=UPI0036A2D053
MRSPCVKPEHVPFLIGEDRVQIGGTVPGIAGAIKDPDGWWWALLVLLDGTRAVDQVVAAMVHRFPAHPESDVRDALDVLYREGHLYDADAPDSDLDQRQREYYSRAQSLWRLMDRTPRRGYWEVQDVLRDAAILQIGVGGVGCGAAMALTQSGVGSLHLMDPDVVELSNLARQCLYTYRDIGAPKVEAATRRLRVHNEDVEITAEQAAVEGPEQLRRLVSDYDLLVMAADAPTQIRDWANGACLVTGTPWVYGGYHGPLLVAGAYRPGFGACFRCTKSPSAEPEITEWPGEVPAFQAASPVSSAYAGITVAHLAMSLLTGVPSLPHNHEYRLNLVKWRSEILTAPSAGCPACL